MSANMLDYTVSELARMSPRWDEMIAADLMNEVDSTTSVSATDMRLALSIKGYREIYKILTAETDGKPAIAALRAMALALRRYAKERPGLSAATFRRPMIESAEWMEAATAVRRLFIKTFQKSGLDEAAAGHALRMLRSLVHGYVIGEMSGSFCLSADKDESFDLAVDVFLRGLHALMPCSHEHRSRSAEPATS